MGQVTQLDDTKNQVLYDSKRVNSVIFWNSIKKFSLILLLAITVIFATNSWIRLQYITTIEYQCRDINLSQLNQNSTLQQYMEQSQIAHKCRNDTMKKARDSLTYFGHYYSKYIKDHGMLYKDVYKKYEQRLINERQEKFNSSEQRQDLKETENEDNQQKQHQVFNSTDSQQQVDPKQVYKKIIEASGRSNKSVNIFTFITCFVTFTTSLIVVYKQKFNIGTEFLFHSDFLDVLVILSLFVFFNELFIKLLDQYLNISLNLQSYLVILLVQTFLTFVILLQFALRNEQNQRLNYKLD